MVILYEVYENLNVNMTNRCPCACTFCLRQTMDEMNHSGSLWLEREPEVEEVIAAFDRFDMTKYRELVFCGFGEPTERLADLLKVAEYAKKTFGIAVRVNTNGLSDLIWEKDTAPMYEGLVDTISISLNTPDPEEYLKLTRSKFGIQSHAAMLRFAGNVSRYVPNVVLSTVETTITEAEENQCREICSRLGVTYRIRPFED